MPPFAAHGYRSPPHGEVPVGTVIAFAGRIDPDAGGTIPASLTETAGWLPCDGRPLDSNRYPILWRVLGTLYGSLGEGTFRLPDYRGWFLRGIDGGSGNDPDVSDREGPAGAPGDKEGVGSTQLDALQQHVHDYLKVSSASAGKEGAAAVGLPPDQPTSGALDARVSDHETRPKNVYVHLLIRAW